MCVCVCVVSYLDGRYVAVASLQSSPPPSHLQLPVGYTPGIPPPPHHPKLSPQLLLLELIVMVTTLLTLPLVVARRRARLRPLNFDYLVVNYVPGLDLRLVARLSIPLLQGFLGLCNLLGLDLHDPISVCLVGICHESEPSAARDEGRGG